LKYNLKLKEIDEKDVQFLYNLLEERKPVTYISHKKMPTYEEHVNFVKSSPYSKWYIIEVDGERAGSIYLTKQNEIGIFLNEGLQEKGIGSNALNVLIGKNPDLRYLANINPENKKSIKFFKKLGFTLIQYTYELNK
jgi:RimJ/RimL family protein N-acetyltransferase